MGMRIVPAEEGVPDTAQQDEEIDGHIEIVRDHCRGDQGAIGPESISQGHEIDPAADIGTGHHGRHLGQPLDERTQQDGAKDGAANGTNGSDEENEEEPARFPPDPAQIGLEQEQRNGDGHSIAPDDIIKELRMHGYYVQIDEDERKNQGDHGA